MDFDIKEERHNRDLLAATSMLINERNLELKNRQRRLSLNNQSERDISLNRTTVFINTNSKNSHFTPQHTNSRFSIGEIVTASYGQLTLAAKVNRKACQEGKMIYFLHYDKTGDVYDEWVDASRMAPRLFPTE